MDLSVREAATDSVDCPLQAELWKAVGVIGAGVSPISVFFAEPSMGPRRRLQMTYLYKIL